LNFSVKHKKRYNSLAPWSTRYSTQSFDVFSAMSLSNWY